MKVEKRGDSCFISHSDLTIFINKFYDKKTHSAMFQVRVQKAEYEQGAGMVKKWHLVGTMYVDKTAYMQLLDVMRQLYSVDS